MLRHISVLLMLAVIVCLPGAAQDSDSAKAAGEAIYRERCASCHEGQVARSPVRSALAQMSRQDIRIALTTGNMRTQAANLSPEQVDALARFLSEREAVEKGPSADTDICPVGAPAFQPREERPHWNGWGVDVTQHRFQPAAMARLRADDLPSLKLKWAFGYEDANQAYAQPTIVAGRIFVGSAANRVYSLDAKTGCIYWVLRTDSPVRTAITIGANGNGWAAYFGDQHGNVYAVDALTGNVLWKTSLDAHPDVHVTGAPTLAEGKLYVGVSSLEEVSGADAKYECCKFRGSLSALDAATGKVIWKTYTIAEEAKPASKNKNGVQLWGPSGAGIWSSPTVDLKKHMVYVTTGDNYSDPPTNTSDAFLALDMGTGKIEWSSQTTKADAYNVDCDLPAEQRVNCPGSNGPDFDFGSSAILVDLQDGKRALVAGAKSGVVYAVDPDRRGKLLWRRRVGRGGTLGGVQWGSAADAVNIYVAVSDVQRRAAAPGSAAGRPSVYGVPYELDPNIGGGLFALKLASGEIVWHTPHPGCDRAGCSPAQSAAVTAIPGVVFSGGVDGHLRAYSMKDGKIIWDVDTQREYQTVNGVKASGGSLDESGAVIVDGMLFVNSGYFFQGSTAGNVLLAFSVDGK
ncbi:MAG TPA: PQQ-binding-like beta-propeller repeat protein [Candidatus Acidoferrum sp.]|nr:PQQ-binding-like beta-propeller repeat protein [Candidatus Acidoferrum sp.]